MQAELSSMITEIVAAAGRGAESLRQTGTEVVLEACSIEVMVDDQPSAHVRISFTERTAPGRSA